MFIFCCLYCSVSLLYLLGCIIHDLKLKKKDIHVFKSGTNRFLSDQVYSDLFFLRPGLFGSVSFGSGSFGKKNLDPKGTCKVLVWFRIGYFWSIPVRVFGSRLKCLGLTPAKKILIDYKTDENNWDYTHEDDVL